MKDTLRDSVLGQLIRYLSGNKYLLYPEERPDYVLPKEYVECMREKSSAAEPEPIRSPAASEHSNQNTLIHSPGEEASNETEGEADVGLTKTRSVPLAPTVTASGDILVNWYTDDDNENPQNWASSKKVWVCIVLCSYTFVVYAGSAMVTTGLEGIIEKFKVAHVAASLTLSLYVLAYGIGPLLFSPLSEIPTIGRLPVYAVTMTIFVLMSIPTPIVGNFAGLLVLRFLQGFFGSPCLAAGGATMQDMYSFVMVPYAMTAWVSAAYCGPALSPLISGFAVMHNGWRWSLWPILWSSGFVLIFMLTLFPETAGPTILLRRARRLRKLTGNPRIKSQSEIDAKNMTTNQVFKDAIIKPFEITIKDPAIAFVNIYTAIIYGIYYSFFEAFPIVYGQFYGFSIGIIGVVFTCILVSCLIGIAIYVAYQKLYLIPDINKRGFRAQEHRLVPALFASFGPPIGLFIFAWASKPNLHWIGPTIGIVIYGASAFVLMQCIFVYVPFTYPKYAASLFAANDFFRSALACGSVLFATPMYDNLGIGRGTSLLGGLSVIGIIGIFVLYYHGATLRARSKFTS